MVHAIRYYDQWGGMAKVRQLALQYQAILPQPNQALPAVDVEMIQHEFSADLEVKSLVSKLMVMLLRVSGSTRVVIEYVTPNGDLQRLGASSLLHHIENHPDEDNIPVSMVLLAHRSQNTLVVDDLLTDRKLGDTTALRERGVQSLLILPVTVRDQLSLIIYLENTFASHWYTPERIRWTRITANQGAVTIENARIHEVAIKLNRDIRQEMDEKERLAAVIEKQKDQHMQALVQTQDNERKRIAGDLHDSLGALLSSVKLRFNSLQADVARKLPEKSERFDTTIHLLDEAVQELRRIAHNMLPVSLERFGLEVALNTFIEQINVGGKLTIESQILGFQRRLPLPTEMALYRICQELVQNVIKHANASHMRIQLIDHSDMISLIVEDNGSGMIENQVVPGFGFSTIQSKIELLKGTFTIESQQGKGSMMLINIPHTPEE